MKKFAFYKLLCLVAAAAVLFSCEDAPYYGEGIKSEFNKLYSSKSAKDHVTADLALTYSGDAFYGKEVYFNLMTATTAKLKFYGVFPGEAQTVIDDVAVSRLSTGKGYNLSGSYTTAAGTSFTCQGTVAWEEGANLPRMTLDLSGITIPANPLSAKGTFTMADFAMSEDIVNGDTYQAFLDMNLLLKWRVKQSDGTITDLIDDFQLMSTVNIAVNNLLYLILADATFHPDGNITATYCPIPENLDINQLLGGASDSDRGPKSVSPKGLISYYVNMEEGAVYIRPELENILRTVQSANTRADGDDEDGGLLGGMSIMEILQLVTSVLDVYPELNRWLTEGIPMRLEKHDAGVPVDDYVVAEFPMPGFNVETYFSGDYKLYLDYVDSKDYPNLIDPAAFKGLLNLLPMILSLVDLDLGDLGGMMGDFTGMISRTNRLNLGLYLHE